jgi:hypothetical protein
LGEPAIFTPLLEKDVASLFEARLHDLWITGSFSHTEMYRRTKTERNTAILKSGLRLVFSGAMGFDMQLSDWLSRNQVRPSDLAARIGVSPQTITGWCQGSFWISKENARKIFEETRGEVTPTDLMLTKVKA